MISVIIPLYNKQELISSCLHSVLSQTVLPSEIVIVNDGSTDASMEIVESVASRNNLKIKFNVINQVNSGVSAARNNGVLAASNEFIALLDADDEWQSDFIEKMLILIRQYPDAAMYSSFHKIKDSEGNFFKPRSVLPDSFKGYIKNYAQVSIKMPVVNSSKVILRRKEFLEIGGFTVGAALTEDLLFWFKISLKFKIAFLNESLITINQFEDESRSGRENKTPYIIDYYCANKTEYSELEKDQKRYLYSVYFKHLLGSLKEANYIEAKSRYKAGFELFPLKSALLAFLFLIPPFFYKLARSSKRKFLTLKSSKKLSI